LPLTAVAILFGLLLGFFQGLRHAFEPDHVVAISTMVTQARTLRTRVAYAVAWGVGHAVVLLVVGAILMVARAQLPPRLDAAFELAVAIMLVALGVRAILHAAGHARPEAPGRSAPQAWRAIGPLAMGMIHGLAGSGALTALVVARLPSRPVGVLFMMLFGAGATLGMSALVGVAGAPLAQVLRTRWGMPALLGATGLLSLGLGLVWLGPAIRDVLVVP
jgi:hypothetical protein